MTAMHRSRTAGWTPFSRRRTRDCERPWTHIRRASSDRPPCCRCTRREPRTTTRSASSMMVCNFVPYLQAFVRASRKDQEELYEKWQDKSLRYQEELRRYKLQNRGKEQRGTVATATPRGQKLKLLQEMMDECGALKVDLVADAAKSPRYVDSLRIHPEEMQRKQKALFKEEITKEATRQRLQAAEMRMRGVQKMQQEQRALRNHMRLEKEHEPLRLVTVSARSQEQKRALSLGAPPWLMSITPRPWSS